MDYRQYFLAEPWLTPLERTANGATDHEKATWVPSPFSEIMRLISARSHCAITVYQMFYLDVSGPTHRIAQRAASEVLNAFEAAGVDLQKVNISQNLDLVGPPIVRPYVIAKIPTEKSRVMTEDEPPPPPTTAGDVPRGRLVSRKDNGKIPIPSTTGVNHRTRSSPDRMIEETRKPVGQGSSQEGQDSSDARPEPQTSVQNSCSDAPAFNTRSRCITVQLPK